MSHRFAEIAFTPSVRLMQYRHGSRAQYARLQESGGPNDTLGPQEAAFLARADSFYLSTVSETGWPYVQHRGGPAGFLGCFRRRGSPSPTFAATCNTSARQRLHDDRVAIIVMDYANRRRLKLLGHLTFVAVPTRIRTWSAGGAAQLPRPRRTRGLDRGRRLRLELPAAHHGTVHGSASGSRDAAAARPDRRAGSASRGDTGLTRRASDQAFGIPSVAARVASHRPIGSSSLAP